MDQSNPLSMITVQHNWMNQIAKQISDHDLAIMVEEIDRYQRMGMLSEGAMLRKLSDHFSAKALDKIGLRATEGQVLFEAARRFHNNLLSDENGGNT